MSRLEYPIAVEPLPMAEGGGFLATAPDLPGCMGDGATPEEAGLLQGSAWGCDSEGGYVHGC
jgi:hypothetical protein